MLAAQLCQLTQTDTPQPPSLQKKRKKRLLFVVTPTLPVSSREPDDALLLPLHVPFLPPRSQPRTAMSLSRLNSSRTPEPRYHLPTSSLSHHSPSFAPSPLRHPSVSPARDLPDIRVSPRSPCFFSYLRAFRVRRLPGERPARSHLHSISRPKPLCPRENRHLPALRLVSMRLPARSLSSQKQPSRQDSPGSLRSWDYDK